MANLPARAILRSYDQLHGEEQKGYLAMGANGCRNSVSTPIVEVKFRATKKGEEARDVSETNRIRILYDKHVKLFLGKVALKRERKKTTNKASVHKAEPARKPGTFQLRSQSRGLDPPVRTPVSIGKLAPRPATTERGLPSHEETSAP